MFFLTLEYFINSEPLEAKLCQLVPLRRGSTPCRLRRQVHFTTPVVTSGSPVEKWPLGSQSVGDMNQGPRVWVFVGVPWISKKQQQKLNYASGSSIETLVFAGSYSVETMIT